MCQKNGQQTELHSIEKKILSYISTVTLRLLWLPFYLSQKPTPYLPYLLSCKSMSPYKEYHANQKFLPFCLSYKPNLSTFLTVVKTKTMSIFFDSCANQRHVYIFFYSCANQTNIYLFLLFQKPNQCLSFFLSQKPNQSNVYLLDCRVN